MKLNIVLNEKEVLEGYDNVHISKVQEIVNGSYQEVMSNITFELAPELVPALVMKAERGGTILVSLVNIEKLTIDFCNNFIDINGFNQFARQRNHFYTQESMIALCAKLNLTIIEQSNNGYITNFLLQRN